jgi:hypothetical protein
MTTENKPKYTKATATRMREANEVLQCYTEVW